jgi:hypothetical protein
MMEFVNGKDDIPYMKWKITNVPNHQPNNEGRVKIGKQISRVSPKQSNTKNLGRNHLPKTNQKNWALKQKTWVLQLLPGEKFETTQ